MKIFIIVSIVFLLSLGAKAQTAASPDSSPVSIVFLWKEELYLANNPLKISVAGVGDERVSATISQGTLTKLSGMDYVARPDASGVAAIEVFVDGRRVGGGEFPVSPMPNPFPTVAGRTGGSISKTELLSAGGIAMNDFGAAWGFEITRFTFELTRGYILRSDSDSPNFTDEQIRIIREMRHGERVIFSDIEAKRNDRTFRLVDLTFRIDTHIRFK